MTNQMEQQELFFNGINGDSGQYNLPPMSTGELSRFILRQSPAANLEDLRLKYLQASAKGLVDDLDPLRLDQAGWGIIFAHDADPALEEALSELIQLRREQAGPYFHLFKGAGGFRRPKDTKEDFLARHGMGPGPAVPGKVPYYLLIAGSPQDIPYQFQSQLDVQYAVGRIHFETLDEYANYARSVVAAEKGEVKLPREAAYFGVANKDDRSTQLSARELVQPLHEKLAAEVSGWRHTAVPPEEATKARLAQLLGGDQKPALLFTASHGMSYGSSSPHLLPRQGALLCGDWPGPELWRDRGPIAEDHYFAAHDLAGDADLSGAIAFFFACYSAGTPLYDEFARQAFRERAAIAPHPFLARLPQKMLGLPRGALAAIGHVERTWGYSFTWPGAGRQTAVFSSTFKRLFKGTRVGHALEYFNLRYAELATVLNAELEEIDMGQEPDPYKLAGLWTANNDARGYALIGDPAVRLPVEEADDKPDRHPKQQGRTPPAEPVIDVTTGIGTAAAGEPQTLQPLTPDADDLQTIIVETYAAADPANPQDRRLLIQTRLDLDGKTETNYAAAGIQDDPQLIPLHQAMVQEAVAARLAYLNLRNARNDD